MAGRKRSNERRPRALAGDPRVNRIIVAALYAGLLVAAIPWYWPADNLAIWFGFPAWVVTAIGFSALASILTAIVLRKPWPSETPDDHE